MKNIDKLKEMNFEELIEFINGNKCDRCIYNNTNCMHDMCREGTKSWLQQECELTIKEVGYEFDEFCSYNYHQPECCIACKYENTTCKYNFLVDNYNISNGKITRREKHHSRIK